MTNPTQDSLDHVAKLAAVDADRLIDMMSAYQGMSAERFHAAYPEFGPKRDEAMAEYGLEGEKNAHLAASLFAFLEFADTIYWDRQKASDPRLAVRAHILENGDGGL